MGSTTTAKRQLAPLLSLGLLAGAAAAQSRFPKLDAYIDAYRRGRIVYLESGGGREAGTTLDSLGPEGRLARALDEAVASDTPQAAERLLSLVALAFDPDPVTERERFAARQPWAVREKAADAVASLRARPTLDYLLERVLLVRSTYPPLPRAAAARAIVAGRHPRAVAAVRSALRDPDPEVRAAAATALGGAPCAEAARALLACLRDDDPVVRARIVESLARIAPAAREAPEPAPGSGLPDEVSARAAGCLSDPDWRVRAAAADFFVLRPSASAVEPLLAAMEAERARGGDGRKRVVFSVVRALTVVAGSAISLDDPSKWRQWWAAHRGNFRIPPGVTASVGPVSAEPTYFGIPVRTDRVVFVLDVSGSMAEPATGEEPPIASPGPRRVPRAPLRAPRGTAVPAAAFRTKLDRAKEELLGILSRLGPQDRFNVVIFSGTVERLFDSVVPATPENRELAAARIRTVRPAGGTNLFGALESALRIHGVAVDRFYTDADTVFVLSDGEPTAGPVVDPDTIAGAIGAANLGSRIAVHAIYLGGEGSPAVEFMRRLSRENYGEFRRVNP